MSDDEEIDHARARAIELGLLPSDEQLKEELAQHRVIMETHQRFLLALARRTRIARWSLIPYGLAGAASGYGMWEASNALPLRYTLLLVCGFVGLVSLQWIIPELQRYDLLKTIEAWDARKEAEQP